MTFTVQYRPTAASEKVTVFKPFERFIIMRSKCSKCGKKSILNQVTSKVFVQSNVVSVLSLAGCVRHVHQIVQMLKMWRFNLLQNNEGVKKRKFLALRFTLNVTKLLIFLVFLLLFHLSLSLISSFILSHELQRPSLLLLEQVILVPFYYLLNVSLLL